MPTIIYKNAKGKRVSGVTTVENNIGWNKEPLKWWAWKCGKEDIDIRKATEKAQDAGTCGHLLVDCDIHKITPDLSGFVQDVIDKGKRAYENYLKWAKMVNFKPIATEINLVSEKYQFGGCPDMVAEIMDELALFDWKTGNAVYIEMLIQMYAYKVLWEENNPDKPLTGGVHLVRFTKETASFHHHHWEWNDLYEAGVWDCFIAALTLHNNKKKLEDLL